MCLLFTVVLGLLQFRLIRDSHLPYLCYGILFFTAAFCFISMPTVGIVFPVDTREVMAEGVWQIVFVIFLSYAMMPLQIWEAALFGLILPSIHVGLTGYNIYTGNFQYLAYQQVCALALPCNCARALTTVLPFCFVFASAGCKHGHLCGRQCGRVRGERDDGAGPAARLPRHAQLHRGPARDGGREREARAAAAVRAAAARRDGDEERHPVAGRGPVPQDLHPEAREREHPVRGHRRLHRAGVPVQRPGAGAAAERAVRPVRPAGARQPLSADQDTGRLLLLRVGHTGPAGRPRTVRGRDGAGYDRRDRVGGGADGRDTEHARRHPFRARPVRCARAAQVAVRRLVERCDAREPHGKWRRAGPGARDARHA